MESTRETAKQKKLETEILPEINEEKCSVDESTGSNGKNHIGEDT